MFDYFCCMKIWLILLVFSFIIGCGSKVTQKNPNKPPFDSTIVNKTPGADKSYLKKRPEEFNEFFMLTNIIPFTGKVATKKDVEKKLAVFNLNAKNDPSHQVLNIRLPFYAFLLQAAGKPSKFVAIMQAETLKGDTILGYKEANGLFGICKPRELEYFEMQRDKVYAPPQ
jgi:hypothetical protein